MRIKPIESKVPGVRNISKDTDPDDWEFIQASYAGKLESIGQVSVGSILDQVNGEPKSETNWDQASVTTQ
jgi:hypothetical protein